MAVWKPEELADDVPIVLGQPFVVQLNLWSTPPLSSTLLMQCSYCSCLQSKCFCCSDFRVDVVEVNDAPEMAGLTVPRGDHSPQPSPPGWKLYFLSSFRSFQGSNCITEPLLVKRTVFLDAIASPSTTLSVSERVSGWMIVSYFRDSFLRACFLPFSLRPTPQCHSRCYNSINAHNSHNNYQIAYQHPHSKTKDPSFVKFRQCHYFTWELLECWGCTRSLGWSLHLPGTFSVQPLALQFFFILKYFLELKCLDDRVTYIWPKQETGLVVVIGMQVIPNHWLSLQNLWTIRSRRSCISYLWFHFRQATFGWNIWTVVIRPWLSYHLNAKGQNTNDHNTS